MLFVWIGGSYVAFWGCVSGYNWLRKRSVRNQVEEAIVRIFEEAGK